MTPVEVLRKARVHIQERWAKADDAGNLPLCMVCADTAIDVADDFRNRNARTAEGFLMRAIGPETKEPGDIWDWNDAPERTLEDVLDAYDRAIALASEQPS